MAEGASSPDQEGTISLVELGLATRNHGMPLEALRWPCTPVGLHYLLTHYDVPQVAPDQWSLRISGRVREPRVLSLADLQSRPRSTAVVTMECAGNGRAQLSPRPVSQPWLVEAVGTGEWSGTRLGPLLEDVGLLPDARQVVFRGLDRGVENGVEQSYERALDLDDALEGDVLLADTLNGQPLPPQHGFPLRLVVPGWYGMTNVKWLTEIEVIAETFAGYQQSHAYRLREHEDEPGIGLRRMSPRALMVPPGIPDFLTRRRFVPLGEHVLIGRAWSGSAPVVAVDVSVDGGRSWDHAVLDEERLGRWAWRGWSFAWTVERPGELELCCRARDENGNEQPLEPQWNLGGYANNAVQRIEVTAR